MSAGVYKFSCPFRFNPMNTPKKISTLLAAGMMAATAVTLAQNAAPDAAAPAASAPMAPPAGSGGRRGGTGPAANTDIPNPTELAALNKALRDLIAKQSPEAKAALDAHPMWSPLTLGGFGAAGARGAGGRRGGGGGAGAGGGGAGG